MNKLKYGVAAAVFALSGTAYAQAGPAAGTGSVGGGVTGNKIGGESAATGSGSATGGMTATPPRTPSTGAAQSGGAMGSAGASRDGATGSADGTAHTDTSANAGVSLSSAKRSDVAMGAKVMGAGGASLGTVSKVTTNASGKITRVTVKGADGGAMKTIPASDLRLDNGTLMSTADSAGAHTGGDDAHTGASGAGGASSGAGAGVSGGGAGSGGAR